LPDFDYWRVYAVTRSADGRQLSTLLSHRWNSRSAAGRPAMLGEFVATFGLMAVI
jgi:hypothetical protein